MRAVALDFEKRRLRECEIGEPRVERADEVLFRGVEVGVCGTDRDLAGFRLGFPPEGEARLVIGHEALGQVVETGRDVRGFQPGSWVVPRIRRACSGPCPSCAAGRKDLCITGSTRERGLFGIHGYFCTYAVDAVEDLTAVPPELVEVAVLAEPLSVVEKAIERALRIRETPVERPWSWGLAQWDCWLRSRSRFVAPKSHCIPSSRAIIRAPGWLIPRASNTWSQSLNGKGKRTL